MERARRARDSRCAHFSTAGSIHAGEAVPIHRCGDAAAGARRVRSVDGTLTRMIAAIDTTLFDLIARLEASVVFRTRGNHFVQPASLREDRRVDDRTSALLTFPPRAPHPRGLMSRSWGSRTSANRFVQRARGRVARDCPEVAGTTLDLVTEVVDIGGLRVTLADTAGLRARRIPWRSRAGAVATERGRRGSRPTVVDARAEAAKN